MFVIHIRSLDEETIARRIYEEQKEKLLPGLVEETRIICQDLEVEDCNTTRLSYTAYRTLVTKACHITNEKRLRRQASGVKCERMLTESYGRKAYIQDRTISEARNWFRTRFFLQPFAGNYSKDKRYAKTNWLCRCKGAKEEESHIMSGHCEVYGDLQSQFGDLGEDKNLVRFFQAVLDRREGLEEEDRLRQSSTAVDVARSDPGDGIRTSRPRDLRPSGLNHL